MPRAIRRAGVVAVAPHLFVEDVSIASIEQARDAYEATDLRAAPGALSRRPRLGVPRLERRLARARRSAHWNIEAEIAAIACPVLAIQGEDDEYGTLAQIRADRARLPKTRLLVIADCGHSPHRDQPEILSREAGRFILRNIDRH